MVNLSKPARFNTATAESKPWPVGTDSIVLGALFRNNLHALHYAMMVDPAIADASEFDPYHGLGER